RPAKLSITDAFLTCSISASMCGAVPSDMALPPVGLLLRLLLLALSILCASASAEYGFIQAATLLRRMLASRCATRPSLRTTSKAFGTRASRLARVPIVPMARPAVPPTRRPVKLRARRLARIGFQLPRRTLAASFPVFELPKVMILRLLAPRRRLAALTAALRRGD